MPLLQSLAFVARHPLNRSKFAAFRRVLSWQIASRLTPGPVAVPFVDETRLLMERGATGATGNWYCGLHEAGEMGFVLHALRPGDLFADIGANIGSYTVLAGATGAEVVSVEPVPATFAALSRNIAINPISATAHNVGISDKAGELEFIASLGCMNRVVKEGEDLPTVTVPVTTLDELFSAAPALMKIDVEGHEPFVIKGGARTLASPHLAGVLMETGVGTFAPLCDAMQGFGFAPYAYDPLSRTFSPLGSSSFNAIFLRDAEAMQAHCRAAPRYRLVNGWL